MSEQARIETAVEMTIDNCELFRAQIAEQAREIERLSDRNCAVEDELARNLDYKSLCAELRKELAALKAQPDPWKASGADWCSSIHRNPDAKAWADFFVAVFPGLADKHELMIGWFANAMMAMHDHLKSQPTFNDERVAFEHAYASARSLPVALIQQLRRGDDYAETEGARLGIAWNVWQQARATLSAPSHSEQVLEGWQLVPVEPIDAMLEAGDKYIGTPATYKAMLSACPSPAITKDFSQFLSAVMDAAGLIRHGRQSKELSEYLGMKCMEYRGAAPSAGSQKEQG